MFSDIIKKRHLSDDGELHFVSGEDRDVSARGIYNSVNDILFNHGCQISEGIEQIFTIPSPGGVTRRVLNVGVSEINEKMDESPRAVAAILGGEFDTDEEAIKFLNKAEQKMLASSQMEDIDRLLSNDFTMFEVSDILGISLEDIMNYLEI